MSGNETTCDDGRLLAMLHGQIRDTDDGALLGHIEHCERCQSKLEQLAANADEWQMAGEVLSASARASDDDVDDRGQLFRASRWTERPEAWTESMAKQLLSPPSHPEMLGRLGRYEVERLIGTGGMGVVFKAFDTELNRPVAIKVLAPYLSGSGPARKRFAREARAAAAVVHDHVVPIHNVETEQVSPFLVMQYVAGESLQARLDREGPLELCEILRIGMQAASGLAAAHGQGLVHRDIKPSNILLEPCIERALITDFGLARAADDASITHTGFHPGTPQYMSPEQAAGESVDARSDLFSLGSVLYAMCTGRPPFRAETSLGVLRRIADHEPRPVQEINPSIPSWLCGLIAKLMAKRPEDRYGSAREVAGLLEECVAHVQQPAAIALPAELQPVKPQGSRWRIARWLAAGAGAFFMLFAAIVIVLEWNKGTLTIECEAASVPIRITQGDTVVAKLTVTSSGKTVRVAAGTYVVEIEGDASQIVVRDGNVTIHRGDTAVVRIAQRPAAQAERVSLLQLRKGDGSPVENSTASSIVETFRGYQDAVLQTRVFGLDEAGNCALSLPAGEHLLAYSLGLEQRHLLRVLLAENGRIDPSEIRLRETATHGSRLTIDAVEPPPRDAGRQMIAVSISNTTTDIVRLTERDLTIVTSSLRVFHPRYFDIGNRPLGEFEMQPGETKTIELDWGEWVREGHWARRTEPMAESWAPSTDEVVWMKVTVGNISTKPIQVVHPLRVKADSPTNGLGHSEAVEQTLTQDLKPGAEREWVIQWLIRRFDSIPEVHSWLEPNDRLPTVVRRKVGVEKFLGSWTLTTVGSAERSEHHSNEMLVVYCLFDHFDKLLGACVFTLSELPESERRHASPACDEVRKTAETWFTAALQGDVATARSVAINKPADEYAIWGFAGLLLTRKIPIREVWLSDSIGAFAKEALAITEPTDLNEPNPKRDKRGQLVFKLQRNAKGWVIRDIDLEDATGILDEVQRFQKGHDWAARFPASMPHKTDSNGSGTGIDTIAQ